MRSGFTGTRPRTGFTALASLIAGLALGFVVWQFAGLRYSILFATPRRTVERMTDLASSGQLGSAIIESATYLLAGFGAAAVFGILYGLLVARAQLIRVSTEWVVYFAQAVPIVAVIPIILSAFGFGFGAKTLVVFLVCVFPICINTAEGARRTPKALLDVTKVYHSGEVRIWLDLLLPHTLPYAMTGLRQGLAYAFVGTMAAEFFLSATGVGGMMLTASGRVDSPAVIGLTIMTGAVATMSLALVSWLEGRVSTWRQE
jgi:NitT/TauT family transport system permease protein